MAHRGEDWLGAAFGVVVTMPIVGSLVAAAGILLWKAGHWLQFAVWPNVTLRQGLNWWYGYVAVPDQVQTGFLGLDGILQWALNETSIVPWLVLGFPLVPHRPCRP